MKKITLFTLALCVIMFTGCGKDDDDNTYDVKIDSENTMSEGTTQIKAIVGILETENELASASSLKKPVVIKLPLKVATKHLTPIGDSHSSGNYTVSDPNVKWTGLISFYGYNDAGVRKTIFYLENNLSNALLQEVYYVYAEKDVTVKGGYEQEGRYLSEEDFSLKAGWNQLSVKIYFDYDGIAKVVINNIIIGSPKWEVYSYQ